MTEIDANDYIENLSHNKDLLKHLVYAAVIIHPIKENEFAVEIGINDMVIKIDESIKSYSSFSSFPDDIIEEYSDQIEFLNGCDDTRNPDISRYEYIKGGISISSKHALNVAGTLGGIFKMKNDSSNYFITNAHVLNYGTTNEGENIVVHPAKADATSENRIEIGKIIWKSSYKKNLDVAIGKLYPEIKIDSFVKCENIKFIKDIQAQIKVKVKKCGRTTGYTEGTIISTNALVRFEDGLIFKNQILTTCMANSGDSGSILASSDNNVVGLIFAKIKNNYTVAHHFKQIFQQTGSKNQNITFKKFINSKTNIMSKTITVNRKDTTNPYELIEYPSGEKIESKFTKWDSERKSNATEIEIVQNAADHEILRIDYVKSGSCNELQIKVKDGNTTSSFTSSLNKCDLNSTKVVILQFLQKEIDSGLHNQIMCSKDYLRMNKHDEKGDPIPVIKKGNIIIGNP